MFFTCKKFLQVLCALAVFTVFFIVPVYSGDEDRVSRMIRKLDDPKYTQAAIRHLVKLQQKAVPHLLREALHGKSIVRRGWAIFCLSQIDGNITHLQKMYEDGKQPPLVRTWALAACIHKMDSLAELMKVDKYLYKLPAVKPLLGKRVITVLSREDSRVFVAKLIYVTRHIADLQSILSTVIIQQKPQDLVRVMLTAEKQEVRRLAAGYLASMGRQNDEQIALEVVNMLKFDDKAADVPWANGPLFLPRLRWEYTTAKMLVKNLISWLLWCKRRGKKDEERQIHNNIISQPLARSLGYSRWNMRNSFVLWGKVVGKKQLQRLFKEQGVHEEKYYMAILDKTPDEPMKTYHLWDTGDDFGSGFDDDW